jgi:hypothetical protein
LDKSKVRKAEANKNDGAGARAKAAILTPSQVLGRKAPATLGPRINRQPNSNIP